MGEAGGCRALPPPPPARALPRSPRRASRGGFSISFFSTSGKAPARPRCSCCAAAPALPPAAVGSGPPAAAAAASWCAARPGILPASWRASCQRLSTVAAAGARLRQLPGTRRQRRARSRRTRERGEGRMRGRLTPCACFSIHEGGGLAHPSRRDPPPPPRRADWPAPPGGAAPRGQAPPSPPFRGRRGHAPPARRGTCRGGFQRLISMPCPASPRTSSGRCVTASCC